MAVKRKGIIMKTFKFPSASANKRLREVVNRHLAFKAKDIQVVKRILADIQKRKDKALIGYVNRFDAPKLTPGSLKVTRAEIDAARGRVDKGFLKSLNKAVRHIEAFHRPQVNGLGLRPRRTEGCLDSWFVL